MPTEPHHSILYPDLSKAEARDVIEIASPLLRELVNYASSALLRCATSTSGKVDNDIATLALYRHIIEMTDGIEVLLSQACSNPVVPLLRSSFEAVLSIEYILETEEDYVHRSLSWLVGYVHKRLDMYERLEFSTSKGKEFRNAIADDKMLPHLKLPSTFAAAAGQARTNLKPMLTKPHIKAIQEEYCRFARRPNWYRLFGGPANLRELTPSQAGG